MKYSGSVRTKVGNPVWEQQKADIRAELSLWMERARIANQVGSI